VAGIPQWSGDGLCHQGGRIAVGHQLLAAGAGPARPRQSTFIEGVRRYHQRGELLRLLEEPSIEPTNNRVERALRPAVIARKVSHCSKNDAGAYAFSVFKSIVQTLAKGNPGSVVDALYRVFRPPEVRLTPG